MPSSCCTFTKLQFNFSRVHLEWVKGRGPRKAARRWERGRRGRREGRGGQFIFNAKTRGEKLTINGSSIQANARLKNFFTGNFYYSSRNRGMENKF